MAIILLRIVLVFFCMACGQLESAPEQAIIIKTIAEMNNSFPPPYNEGASPDEKSCRRAHQALFLERFFINDMRDGAAQIYNNNLCYKDPEPKGEPSTFWTDQENIIPLAQLPEHIKESLPAQKYGQEPTIVLKYPWQQFSVGTRFKHLTHQDTATAYAIALPDFQTNRVKKVLVPKDRAIQEINRTAEQQRALFVEIITNLIQRVSSEQGLIPYVWGGSSFVKPYSDAEGDIYKNEGVWRRKGADNPFTGYDCSELVWRLAQIAGIPFAWKTTTIMNNHLPALDLANDTIQPGDLIWYKGHVMIIIDKEKGILAEARGYASGFGKVHLIHVNEVFDNAIDMSDVIDLIKDNKPIVLKNKHGDPMGTYHMKILKLMPSDLRQSHEIDT